MHQIIEGLNAVAFNVSGPAPFIGARPPGTIIAQREHQLPFSNTVKQFANWKVCYSCGFDIGGSHTSMLCPMHLCKASHNIYFTCQNMDQYINMGHPCSTRNRHKTMFPSWWWLGATNNSNASNGNFTYFVSTLHLLYPTENSSMNDDDGWLYSHCFQ